MCKISVIMSVYNGQEYLKESIESILNQTYSDFEFIIINDGSSDNSIDIINRYAQIDDRIVVISRKNKGLITSLNEGIAIAKGEYIARMDCDDISLPERFEKQINFFEKNKDVSLLGTYIIPFGDAEQIEKDTKEIIYNFKIEDCNLEKRILKDTIICHPTLMIKTNVIKELGGYSCKYYTSEDYDLLLRAFARGYKIRNLKDKLMKYRVHKNSKTFIDSSQRRLEEFMNMKLDYLIQKKKRKINCLIWGTGKGGILVKETIGKRNDCEIMGFVDTYKRGYKEDFKIFEPKDIFNIEFDYIFIATTVGNMEVSKYLEQNGFKQIEKYISFLL